VTLSVLGLEPAAGAPEAVATAVTEALRQRVTSSTGYRLVPGKDLVEVKLVFSCPDEAPPCMTQAAQSIGSAKIIFGNVQPVGTDAFIVTLKLLDAERAWSSPGSRSNHEGAGRARGLARARAEVVRDPDGTGATRNAQGRGRRDRGRRFGSMERRRDCSAPTA
jgi:hypothetical protein